MSAKFTGLSRIVALSAAAELIAVIRQQDRAGADFVKIYETGRNSMLDGELRTPYTADQLTTAVEEAGRLGTVVAVHATGEPERCLRRAPALRPSIMPRSRARRPCESCGSGTFLRFPPSPYSSTSRNTPAGWARSRRRALC